MSGMKVMGVEEFLKHDTRGRSEFLGAEWKKKGWLVAWLHRRLPFASCWQHGVPRIDVRDDAETRTPRRMIFTGNYKCIEEEAVLKDQYKRDRETGARLTPPQICPICLMIEYLHTEVIAGRMHWLEPVFDFDAGDPKSRIYLRASGLWNGYKPDRLSDEQKWEMEDAGISPMYGWKENLQAGVKYIFCVVDQDEIGKGVQIMKEGQALGDKVKLAIQKEMKRNPRNPSLGDPVKNPYPFQFEYVEKATPDKKYDASRIDLPLDEAVNKLISDTPAPDIRMLAGDYAPQTLRAQLERAALVELPWDLFFTPEAEEILAKRDAVEEASAPLPAGRSFSAPSPAPARSPAPSALRGAPGAAPRPVAPARAVVPPVEMFACDRCSKPIAATDAACPHCGMAYEVEAPPAPEPPPLRRRSEIRREPQGGATNALPGTRSPETPAMRGQVVAPAAQNAPLRAPARSPAPSALRGAPGAAPRPVAPARAEPPRIPPSRFETPEEAQGSTEANATRERAVSAGSDSDGFGDFGEDDIPFVHCRPDAFGVWQRQRWERA